jgi:hypothetical protein
VLALVRAVVVRSFDPNQAEDPAAQAARGRKLAMLRKDFEALLEEKDPKR